MFKIYFKICLFFIVFLISNLAKVNANQNSWVNIDSEPKKVRITINNKYIGETPINQLELEPGNYTINASKKNYINKIFQFSTSPLLVKNVNIKLLKQNSIINGWVNIKSSPDKVRININGKYVGETPINQLELKPGNYILSASKEYYNKKSISFSIDPLMVENINITLLKGGGWELLQNVKSTSIDSGFGKLTVLTKECYEADVYLNSEHIPKKTPLTFKKIPAGEHIIELRYKNKIVKKKVIIRPDEIKVLKISLNVPMFSIKTNPHPANVVITGVDRYLNSFLSPNIISLNPGKYSLQISRKYFKTIDKNLDIKNKSVNLEIDLTEDKTHAEDRNIMIKQFLATKKNMIKEEKKLK